MSTDLRLSVFLYSQFRQLLNTSVFVCGTAARCECELVNCVYNCDEQICVC